MILESVASTNTRVFALSSESFLMSIDSHKALKVLVQTKNNQSGKQVTSLFFASLNKSVKTKTFNKFPKAVNFDVTAKSFPDISKKTRDKEMHVFVVQPNFQFDFHRLFFDLVCGVPWLSRLPSCCSNPLHHYLQARVSAYS